MTTALSGIKPTGQLHLGNYLGMITAEAALDQVLERELGPARKRFHDLRADERSLDAVLAKGARSARSTAQATPTRVRAAVGVTAAQWAPEGDGSHHGTYRRLVR
jgi:tryptophanyl-tRNA synthetase